jgi:hypothetical protein
MPRELADTFALPYKSGFCPKKPIFSKKEDADEYLKLMKTLEQSIPVWPPIDELVSCGHKFRTIQDLEVIALRLGYARPQTKLVDGTDDVVTGWVLKRERSECMEHVFVPGITKPGSLPGFGLAGSRWIQQEFAPLLVQLGEWRAIFVDQEHIATVHTELKAHAVWSWDVQHDRWSLSELQ